MCASCTHPQRVRSALTRTGKSSLDLVQLYWDDFNVPGWLQVAQVLQELQEHGVIKALGVTNWDVPHLIPLLDKGIKVATNQV